jgi:hypothetical protein
VAAGRAGARTLLLERSGQLGGVAVAGLMANTTNFFFTADGRQVVRGLAEEIIDRTVEMGGASAGWKHPRVPQIPFQPPLFVAALIDLLREAHVAVWLETLVADAHVDEGRLTHLIVENKAGRSAIGAAAFVDCTGDLDVGARAGVPHDEIVGSHSLEMRMANVDVDRLFQYFCDHLEDFGELQDIATPFAEFQRNYRERGIFHIPHGGGARITPLQEAVRRGEYATEQGPVRKLDAFGMYGIRGDGMLILNTGFASLSALDVPRISEAALTARRAAVEAARLLQRVLPGFENAVLCETGAAYGVRLSRRLHGQYRLTAAESWTGCRFDDMIALSPAVEPTGEGVRLLETDYDLPYRVMVPETLEGLITGSGKTVCTDPPGMVRGQMWCMELGQAAGVAAALAAAGCGSLLAPNVAELQRMLLKQGVYLGPPERVGGLEKGE